MKFDVDKALLIMTSLVGIQATYNALSYAWDEQYIAGAMFAVLVGLNLHQHSRITKRVKASKNEA